MYNHATNLSTILNISVLPSGMQLWSYLKISECEDRRIEKYIGPNNYKKLQDPNEGWSGPGTLSPGVVVLS